MNKKVYILFVITLTIQNSCRKPYQPPLVATTNSHLVVEGIINTGSDSTIIHLSRTIPLSSPAGATSPPELNATVAVQGNNNDGYALASAGNGYYVAATLNLNPLNKYRLQITTSDGKVYQSDFVASKNSPPIDSVTYQVINNNKVQINVSTHDPSNNTRYYRWDYNEAWIIHAKYQSQLILQTVPKDTIVFRDQTKQIYRCWNFSRSSDIVLGSTAKLASDVLANSAVTNISSTSERLTERYSILVKQYALTPEAYEYYEALRKNTEQLGTIFDPQPSTLTGNIHCISDPSEQIIGYITAGSVSQQRLYIDAYNLPVGGNWIPATPYNECISDTLYFVNPRTKNNDVRDYLYTGLQIPISGVGRPGKPPSGYRASAGACVDCTVRGTNKQPAFWADR